MSTAIDDFSAVLNPDAKDKSRPQFHLHPVMVGRNAEGVPQYEDRHYVRIKTPGSRDTVDREVNDDDKRRWPMQWHAYEAGQEEVVDGFPVEQWPAASPADVNNMRSLGLRTVEEVAEFQDQYITKLPNGVALKKMAAKFLASQASQASLQARIDELEAQAQTPPPPSDESEELALLRAENRELRSKNTELRRQVREMKAAAKATG